MAWQLIVVLLVVLPLQLYSQVINTFSVQPPSEPLVLTYGSAAEFHCAVQDLAAIERIDWQLFVNESIQYRGVFSIPPNYGIQSTVSGNVYTITIPIREDGITNNTNVRCVVVLQGNNGEINSQNGTIIIQGPLAAVSNLTTGDLIPGRSILLSWVAPFTLNVTNTEPDITYCVDVYINVVLHHIRSTCGITATAYNVTFNEGEVTPCDTVNVTVIPVNGLPNNLMNGTSRNMNPVYLFKGLRNFSSSDIEVSSRQLPQRFIEFNILLPDTFQMCRSNCTVRASSASGSYDLGSENSLICERNVITFRVFFFTITNTELPINDIYFTNIQVANSAGTGYSVGDIQLSTHVIQQVEARVNADDSVSMNLSFISGTSLARGAQVIFRPEELNEATCKNMIIRNIPKSDDSLSSTIRNIPRGSYTINVYTLNKDGIPDSLAEPVTTGMNISISSNTDTSQDSVTGFSVEYIYGIFVTIKYPARPGGYVAVFLYEDYSEYSLLHFPGNGTESTVLIYKEFCLSLFPLQGNNGILYSNTPANFFIQYTPDHTAVIIVGILITGMLFLTCVFGVLCLLKLR